MSEQSPPCHTVTMGAFPFPVGRFSAHDNGAHLVCIDGPGVGAVLPVLAEPVVIGAADSCDLSLNDARVSRRHAQATFTGSAVEILDLDSKNGCYHQGKRFERRGWNAPPA